ncbi:MAG: hypothetical protein GXO22_06225 [Aquificae bacterium]|nr:hypothetical protein [Aquificota bacterium]
MKVQTIFLSIISIIFTSIAQEDILKKLKKPLIKEKENLYFIEHYEKVKLNKKTFILFKQFDTVYLKTECKMEKGLISKGNFVAICVSVGSGFSQGLFNPVFDKIKTIEWVFDKNEIKQADFNIQIDFKESGLKVSLIHERGSQELFIPYQDIIKTKVNP